MLTTKTLHAHQKMIEAQTDSIITLFYLVVALAVIIFLFDLINQILSYRKFKKIKADITRLDSMISQKTDVM